MQPGTVAEALDVPRLLQRPESERGERGGGTRDPVQDALVDRLCLVVLSVEPMDQASIVGIGCDVLRTELDRCFQQFLSSGPVHLETMSGWEPALEVSSPLGRAASRLHGSL